MAWVLLVSRNYLPFFFPTFAAFGYLANQAGEPNFGLLPVLAAAGFFFATAMLFFFLLAALTLQVVHRIERNDIAGLVGVHAYLPTSGAPPPGVA